MKDVGNLGRCIPKQQPYKGTTGFLNNRFLYVLGHRNHVGRGGDLSRITWEKLRSRCCGSSDRCIHGTLSLRRISCLGSELITSESTRLLTSFPAGSLLWATGLLLHHSGIKVVPSTVRADCWAQTSGRGPWAHMYLHCYTQEPLRAGHLGTRTLLHRTWPSTPVINTTLYLSQRDRETGILNCIRNWLESPSIILKQADTHRLSKRTFTKCTKIL